MEKNPKIRDVDLWPVILKFSDRAVVNLHVTAEFHQAECSGSWVIVLTEREKTPDDYNTVRMVTVSMLFVAHPVYACADRHGRWSLLRHVINAVVIIIMSLTCRWHHRSQGSVYYRSDAPGR